MIIPKVNPSLMSRVRLWKLMSMLATTAEVGDSENRQSYEHQ